MSKSEDADVALKPGANADSVDEVKKHISPDVLDLYDVYSYRHAAAIMKTSFPDELSEIEEALLSFRITTEDIAQPGGNESVIPKQFSSSLRPHDWYETRIQGDLLIRVFEQSEEVLPTGKLNPVFEVTPLLKKDGTVDLNSNGKPKLCKQKYGASTTWMGKLLYRLQSNRGTQYLFLDFRVA